jgi:hypothetical protein
LAFLSQPNEQLPFDCVMTHLDGIFIPPKWYPETWSVGGEQVKYRPNLGGIEGQYRSGDPVVVTNHVNALDYARADISIVSCKLTKRLS